jgi:hypothetical protein
MGSADVERIQPGLAVVIGPLLATSASPSGNTLDAAAHVVQLALTPVFFLSGIAALLNVFASRLGRVADQTEALAKTTKDTERDTRLRSLRLRSRALDVAVVLAALAGALTCGAVLVLFLGELRGVCAASLLYFFFGGGVVLTMGALLAFVIEMLVAATGVRRTVEKSVSPEG